MKNYSIKERSLYVGDNKPDLFDHWPVLAFIGCLIIAIIICTCVANNNVVQDNTSPLAETSTQVSAVESAEQKSQQTEQKVVNQKPAEQKPQFAKPEAKYPVVRVIDGDTIIIKENGNQLRVRMIGVDTPETVNQSKPVQCFGPQASDYAKQTLTGKYVGLESDPSQDNTDYYGRLLRYVYIDGENFSYQLIKNGYGREYTYNIPYIYQSEFKKAEAEAKQLGRGLWNPAGCNGNSF